MTSTDEVRESSPWDVWKISVPVIIIFSLIAHLSSPGFAFTPRYVHAKPMAEQTSDQCLVRNCDQSSSSWEYTEEKRGQVIERQSVGGVCKAHAEMLTGSFPAKLYQSDEAMVFRWGYYFLANLGLAAFLAWVVWRVSIRVNAPIPITSIVQAVLPVMYVVSLAFAAGVGLYRMSKF